MTNPSSKASAKEELDARRDYQNSQADSPRPASMLPLLPCVAPGAFVPPLQSEGRVLQLAEPPSSGVLNGLWQPGPEDTASPSRQAQLEASSSTGTSSSTTGSAEHNLSGSSLGDGHPAGSASSLGEYPPTPPSPSQEPVVGSWTGEEATCPSVVRNYLDCAVAWCLLDKEGVVSTFPAATQIEWWHNVHRLVDTLVAQADLCQADGGQRGFRVVAGVNGGDSGSSTRAGMSCALRLLALLRQVRLPSGDFVTVRIGLHLGATSDGLVGSGKTLHYQMVGPTMWTAHQLAVSAPKGCILVSDVAHRWVTLSGSSHHPANFGESQAVPLGSSSDIRAHPFTGQLPEIDESAEELLQQWQPQSTSMARPPVQSASSGRQHQTAEASTSSALHTRQESQSAGEHRPAADGSRLGTRPHAIKTPLLPSLGTEGPAWQRRQFQELFSRKLAGICLAANLTLLLAVMVSHIGESSSDDGGSISVGFGAGTVTVIAAVLTALTFLWDSSSERRSRLSAAARISRICALLYSMQLYRPPATFRQCLEGFSTLTVPLVNIGLLDGGSAHVFVDAVCVGLAALAMPVVWERKGMIAAVVLSIQVLLGVALPSLVLRKAEKAAQRDFLDAARRMPWAKQQASQPERAADAG